MVIIPDLNRLTENEDLGWDIYLTATELVKVLMVWYFVPWIWIRRGAALWFLTQAADEAMGRNIWTEDTGPLEYMAFTILAITTWVLHKLSGLR